MIYNAENNLSLGIAQLLENWVKGGVQLAGRHDANSEIVDWVGRHGSSMVFLSPVQPAETALSIPEESVVAVASSKISKDREHSELATATVPKLELGKWVTSAKSKEARIEYLSQEANLVAACSKCSGLVCSRSRTVYSDGNVMSSIVFVGEGPGAEEDKSGIPFVGAAGQLLDKIITAMNLKRESVYIMNAVKCRPQNNRTPTDDEINNCQPFFINQLEAIQPKFIVCLGAVAARAVLQTTLGIGRLRGRFHSYRGAKVAVTYHPAYLLRTPEAKKLTWDDMKMVMAEMSS